MQTCVRCLDKSSEQRVRLVRFALKFGMKLARHEKRVRRHFNNLHQLPVRCESAEYEPGFLESFPVGVVEFKSMPVAFLDYK